MISVIIPKYEDEMYLIRCLNAIRRQFYKNVEIIVSGEVKDTELINKYNIRVLPMDKRDVCGSLNRAIVQAEGDYIYFCDVTSVISPVVFDELLNVDNDVFTYMSSYVMVGDRNIQESGILSCYGKLFRKSILINNSIWLDGDDLMSEYAFVAKYISVFNKIKKSDTIYEYRLTSDDLCSGMGMGFYADKWTEIISLLKNAEKEVQQYLLNAVIEIIKKRVGCQEKLAELVQKEWHENYELNYVCMAPVLNDMWRQVVITRTEAVFEKFRRLITLYDGESLVSLLLRACGLKKDYYEYIRDLNVSQCLFSIEECERIDASDNEIKHAVRTIRNNPIGGLIKIENKWYYYSNGQLDVTYRGLARNEYGWYYISSGTIDWDYCGLARNQYGWFYITDGVINTKYTGLAMNDMGVWMYVIKGKVDTKYTGLVESNGHVRYVSQGVVDRGYSGLFKTSEGKWVYIENGTINTGFIGLAKNEYGWWYVENGTIDFSFNGFAKNDHGWCEVKNGKALPKNETDMIRIIDEPKGDTEEKQEDNLNVNPSEVAVEYYRNGQLGFGTIMKSIGAWGKYKFKR